MADTPFQRFIALIKFDQDLYQVDQEVAQEVERMRSFTTQIEALHKNHLEQEKRVLALRKEVDKQEQTLRDLDAREKKLRMKISQAHNQKEYQALQKEAEFLRSQQYDLEKDLLGVWNTFESSQREHEAHAVQFAKQKADLDHERQVCEQKINELKERSTEKNPARLAKEEGLPEVWLQAYGRMRNSVSNPVVMVVDGACSACFFDLLPQDMYDVHHHKLVTCKGCYRLLYKESLSQ